MEVNSLKASSKPLLITFSLLKFTLKGSEIFRSLILKLLPPDEVIKQVKNYERLQQITLDDPEYKILATKIFETQIKNLYAIGTVGLPPQPLLLRSNLRNGPKNGEMWSWTYRQWVQFLPEQFWLDN